MNAPDPPTDRRRLQLWWRVSGVVTVLAMIALGVRLAFAYRDALEAARHSQCKSRLKQMALALHNYHEMYGTMPPAIVRDANGKPMHSWRALILPFIDQLGAYQQYDFGQPWDSPHNRALENKIYVDIFQCNTALAGRETFVTDYVAITGPGTLFPDGECLTLQDIKDGPQNTFLLVEIANSDIHWMEPRDLRIDEMSFVLNDPNRPSISSHHPRGIDVVCADGSVRILHPPLNPLAIRAAATIAGGEPYNAGDLIPPPISP